MEALGVREAASGPIEMTRQKWGPVVGQANAGLGCLAARADASGVTTSFRDTLATCYGGFGLVRRGDGFAIEIEGYSWSVTQDAPSKKKKKKKKSGTVRICDGCSRTRFQRKLDTQDGMSRTVLLR
jgi:hypothetical protein